MEIPTFLVCILIAVFNGATSHNYRGYSPNWNPYYARAGIPTYNTLDPYNPYINNRGGGIAGLGSGLNDLAGPGIGSDIFNPGVGPGIGIGVDPTFSGSAGLGTNPLIGDTGLGGDPFSTGSAGLGGISGYPFVGGQAGYGQGGYGPGGGFGRLWCTCRWQTCRFDEWWAGNTCRLPAYPFFWRTCCKWLPFFSTLSGYGGYGRGYTPNVNYPYDTTGGFAGIGSYPRRPNYGYTKFSKTKAY